MNAGLKLALSQVEHHRQQLEHWEGRLSEARKHSQEPGFCPATGQPHATVTFHSAPPDQRKVCVDCSACFPIHEDLLTGPHGRSKM